MSNQERVSELKEIIGKAQSELCALEAKEDEAKNASLVGKCFRTTNSYGGERWWLYIKVLRSEGRGLVCHRFEVTCAGEIRIDPEYAYAYGIRDDHKEIARRDFEREWAALQDLVRSLPKASQHEGGCKGEAR